MSRDAEDKVDAYVHPQVKRSVRDLLKAIAHHIPEGHTATPPMTLDELAMTAQHTGRTAQRCRDVLETVGAIAVHDGGRGKVARYEILNLDGVRPATAAPLPLRADLREAKPQRTKEERSGSDLFSDDRPLTSDILSDDPDVRAYTVRHFFRRWTRYVGHFVRRWWARTIKERSTSDILSDVAPPLGVDDQLARDVHTFKNVHTPAAPRDGPTDDEMASWPAAKVTTPEEAAAYDAWLARGGVPTFAQPKPPVHPWHAWCGPVCVPKKFHEPFVGKGHAAEWLFAFYARTCAGLTAQEARRVVDEFRFWRTALQAELASDAPNARAPTPGRRPDIPIGRPCPHQPPCADGDTDACVDRSMADWRRDQARRSG